jgi:hypothetical protein
MRSCGVYEISALLGCTPLLRQVVLARLPKAHSLATLLFSFKFRQLQAITGLGCQGCQTLRIFKYCPVGETADRACPERSEGTAGEDASATWRGPRRLPHQAKCGLGGDPGDHPTKPNAGSAGTPSRTPALPAPALQFQAVGTTVLWPCSSKVVGHLTR